MTRVAILWHMHQPFYQDPLTREHLLPWVRLHGLKDYLGMVDLLAEFPDVRVTFNLVPSLLLQIEAFVQGNARERYLDLGLKPAADLTAEETAFVAQNFFHAQRARMIDAHPRYAELLARRDGQHGVFTEADLRDLQVWQKLAWIDQSYLEQDPRARGLVEKGRAFSEADKQLLADIEREILSRIIPAYRQAADRGQIEISTSPFYHPILPLLCDTDVHREAHPEAHLPRRRFRHPEDAREQLTRALTYCERVLGRRPVGLWPPEGAVSHAIVPLLADAGLRWMASDELVLARSLGIRFDRGARGRLERPELLYRPYLVRAGGAEVACLFRDHVLSDLIGFHYAARSAEQAADDFVEALTASGQRFAEATGGEEATIPIILDGENAWEHFEKQGRPFLRAMYRRLSDHPDLRTVTVSDACEGASRVLDGIFPGSWIDADFSVWIGHRDDLRAWSQLADARAVVETATLTESGAREAAQEELLIAEGSDWFWWYGDDHSSDFDAEFDELFRRHLRNAYLCLGRPAPEELFVANISTSPAPQTWSEPTGRLQRVILDGRVTHYFEWLGAGTYVCGSMDGSMHESVPAARLNALVFGFDRDRFCLRIDLDAPAATVLERGIELGVSFLRPAGLQLRLAGDPPAAVVWDPQERVPRERGAAPQMQPSLAVGIAEIVELSVPLNQLGAREGDVVAFTVGLYNRGRELLRQPPAGPIELVVPGIPG